MKQQHQNVLLFLNIVTCYLRAELFNVQPVCLPPSTSVTRPRDEDVIDWIMLNSTTFHMRSLLASKEIRLLQQTWLLCLFAWHSNLTVRGNKTNVAKKSSPAFPRSRIFCEWFERNILRLKMCRWTVSLWMLLMLKQAAIQERDEFTENHQQACWKKKERERDERGAGTSQERQVECNFTRHCDAVESVKDLQSFPLSRNTWSVNKVRRLIQNKPAFIFKLQIEFVPFKIVPLEGYTSPETLFPLFVAALEVANRNRF